MAAHANYDCLESDLGNVAESATFQTQNSGFGKRPKKVCWNLTFGRLPNKVSYWKGAELMRIHSIFKKNIWRTLESKVRKY